MASRIVVLGAVLQLACGGKSANEGTGAAQRETGQRGDAAWDSAALVTESGIADGEAPAAEAEASDGVDAPAGACPAARPISGMPCDGGPIDCQYTAPCGPLTMTCGASSSYWAVSMSTACSGACPATEPKKGDSCMAGGKCSYVSGCGGEDIVYCNGTGTVSDVMAGACPACPSQEPAPLGGCPSKLSCTYTNACGGTDVAMCGGVGSTWTVLRGACES
jgi:hypothetical protein